MIWVDIARVAVAGVILGIVIGKLIVRNPHYFERLRPRSWLPRIKRMSLKNWLWLAAVVGISTVAALFVVGEVQTMVQTTTEWEFTEPDYPLHGPLPSEPISPLLVVTAAVLAIPEEWIFRAVLLEEIRRRSRSWLVGLVGSSLMFALFHLSNPGTYPALVIPMAVSGLILGSCYLLSGLGGSTLSHSLYNVIIALGLL